MAAGEPRENYALVDRSQRPSYMLYCCQRWLDLVLSLIVSAQSVTVMVLALALRERTDPGFLGLSLTTVLSKSPTYWSRSGVC